MTLFKRVLLTVVLSLTVLALRPAGTVLAADVPTDTVLPTQDIVALAAQTEEDAAQAVTTDDINQRIDNSEATTLRLSDDIGVMADRIGEMADRILWTEGQIGVMADRIVTSEELIADSALTLADDIQQSTPTLP